MRSTCFPTVQKENSLVEMANLCNSSVFHFSAVLLCQGGLRTVCLSAAASTEESPTPSPYNGIVQSRQLVVLWVSKMQPTSPACFVDKQVTRHVNTDGYILRISDLDDFRTLRHNSAMEERRLSAPRTIPVDALCVPDRANAYGTSRISDLRRAVT